MKSLIAVLMVTALMFSAPVMAQKGEKNPVKSEQDIANEELGKHVLSYLGGFAMLPIHVLDKTVRTLLYMDKE